MIDATTTYFTSSNVFTVMIAVMVIVLIGWMVAVKVVSSWRVPGLALALVVTMVVVVVGGTWTAVFATDHDASHSESSSMFTDRYVTNADVDQWVEDTYGLDVISRGYDKSDNVPNVTAKDAKGDLATYEMVYGDFETKGNNTYLNAELYLDGKPVKPTSEGDKS